MTESAEQTPRLTQTRGRTIVSDGHGCEGNVRGSVTWERREEDGDDAEEDVGRTHGMRRIDELCEPQLIELS